MPRLAGTALVTFTVEDGEPLPPPDSDNTIKLTNRTGAAVANYPLQFGRPFCPGEIPHRPTVLIDGARAPAQADVKNRYADGSVQFAVLAVVVPSLPPDLEVTLAIVDSAFVPGAGPGVGNAPIGLGVLLDLAFGFNVALRVTSTEGHEQTIDFAGALDAGHAILWTEGPVAQTVVIADDGTNRALDLGFGDGFRPLRCRAAATFWPATGQVHVRVVGESGLTTEIEDLAYRFDILAGGETVYSADLTGSKRHWAMSRWSRSFWLGGTPPAEIDIDWNARYLVSTLWLPSYDTSIVLPEATIAGQYKLWTGKPHDIYDGAWNGGQWQAGMATSGERQEIGPYPTWDVMALLSGDWRLREMQFGMADLASAWPTHLRETDPARRLNRTDEAGSGTGLGHTVSITDRQTLVTGRGQLTYSYTKPEHRVQIVGALNINQPWSFDGAHQPQPWLVPYLLSGDPFYLDEAYFWAGNSAGRYNGAAPTTAYGRGPTGAEGVINDEVRGGGWVLRGRVETALMAPDGDPEKEYFVRLANDALARWEAGFGINGTIFDGDPTKTWGAKYGNYYNQNAGPMNGKPPSLGQWESNGNPLKADQNATINTNEANGIYVPGRVGSFTSPWMQFYTVYSLGRAAELGFDAGPNLAHVGRWLIDLINESGYPQLVCEYQSPVEMAGGGFFDWPGFVAAHQHSWLTGEDYAPPSQGCTSLPQYWAQNLNADGREAWAIPGASYLVELPGGAEAWAWLEAMVVEKIPGSACPYTKEPKWAILPRPPGARGRHVKRVGRRRGPPLLKAAPPLATDRG
jgi:hypothetical protein